MTVIRPAAHRAAVSPLAICTVLATTVVPWGAQAQCVTTTAGFQCFGFDPDGVIARRDGVLGFVNPGAQVRGRRSVEVDEQATIVISETATLDGALSGITGGDGLTVLNDGNIGRGFSFFRGGAAVDAEDDVTVANGTAGLISTLGGVVFAGDGLTFTNAGKVDAIAANNRGIFADDDATVINTGDFFSRDNFILSDDDLTVINSGVMKGLGEGITTGDGLELINSGILRRDVPVDADDGATIFNTGRIEGSTLALLARDGMDVTNGPGGSIVVEQDGEAAIRAGTLTIESDGRIEGAVSGIDRLLLSNGEAGTIVGDIYSSRVEIDNNGSIDGEIVALNGSLVTNTGTIFGSINGAYEGAVVTNKGLIQSSTFAVQGSSGSRAVLTNDGEIIVEETAVGSERIGNTDEADVVNNGVIDAGDDGLNANFSTLENSVALIAGDDGVVGGVVDVINLGIIEAHDVGVLSREVARVVNANTITGGSTGLKLMGMVEVINEEGGVIHGGAAALQTDFFATPQGESVGISNSGLVEGEEAGIRSSGASNVIVVNSGGGIITGDGGKAITLETGNDSVSGAAGSRFGGDILLGAGDDELLLDTGVVVEGDVLFGPGDDVLRYERSMFDEMTDKFDLFAGGTGFDEAVFEGFGLGDLSSQPRGGGLRGPVRGRPLAAHGHAGGLRARPARRHHAQLPLLANPGARAAPRGPAAVGRGRGGTVRPTAPSRPSTHTSS